MEGQPEEEPSASAEDPASAAESASTAEPVGSAADPFISSGDADEEEPQRSGWSRKRIIFTAAFGVIIVVFMYFLLFPQISNYEDAADRIRNMAWEWVVALVIAGVANIGLYSLTVNAAIRGLGYWRGFLERQAGFMISNVIPGGGAVAVGTQASILNYYRVRPSMSAAAVAADAAYTYLFTLGMPALAVGLLATRQNTSGLLKATAIFGVILFVVSLVGLLMILHSENGARRIGRWGEKIAAPIWRRFKKPPPDLQTGLVNFRNDAHDLMRRRWVALAITNVVAQLMPFVVLLCALGGLGAFPDSVDLLQAFAAYSVAILLVSFPITPGGLGTVDATLIALLVSFGVDNATAVAADLVWRLVWFLPQLVIGAICMGIFLVLRSRASKRAAKA